MKRPLVPVLICPLLLALAGGIAHAQGGRGVGTPDAPVVPVYYPIPVQSYALVDVSGDDPANSPVTGIALRDDNQLAFCVARYDSKGNKTSVAVRKWLNGVFTTGQTMQTLIEDRTADGKYATYSKTNDIWDTALSADGALCGNTTEGFYELIFNAVDPSRVDEVKILSFTHMAFSSAAFTDPKPPFVTPDPPQYGFPIHILIPAYSTQLLGSSYSGASIYFINGIINQAADGSLTGADGVMACSTPCTLFGLPADPTSGITMAPAGFPLTINYGTINAHGWFIPPMESPGKVWNGTRYIDLPGNGVFVNEDNDVVSGDQSLVHPETTGLLEKGTTYRPFFGSGATSGMIPKEFQNEVRYFGAPVALSNRLNLPATPVLPVLHLLLDGQILRSSGEATWWEGTYFLLREFSDGTTDFHEVNAATGLVGVRMNANGILAVRSGYVGGGGHAYLLYPLNVVYGQAGDSDTNGATTSTVSPAPNAVTGKDGKALSQLAVGKMDHGTISGSGASATLNPDNDADSFYVRITGAMGSGITSVKVAAADNPQAEYNDGPVMVGLHADGNDLVSKSLLLTSDDVDDQVPVDGIIDNADGDRTYKIQLGGKFEVQSYQRDSTDHPLADKLPVPIKKTVHVTPIIVRATKSYLPVGGYDYIRLMALANYQLKVAKERFAQVGVDLTWSPVTVQDPPANVQLLNGFVVVDRVPKDCAGNTIRAAAVLSAAAKRILDSFGTPNDSTDIHVLWMDTVNLGDEGATREFGGFACAPYYFAPSEANYLNNCFILYQGGPFAVVHELGHLLTNDDHINDSHNLMWGFDQALINTLDTHKRLNTAQEAKILNLQPPIGTH